MGADSLLRLKSGFRRWRSKKQNIREAVPEALMERAYRAAAIHGPRAVAVAVKIDQTRLSEGLAGKADKDSKKRGVRLRKTSKLAVDRSVPSFSRIEVARPAAVQPLAELETVSGLKLKVFTLTRETADLLVRLSCHGGVS